MSFLKKAGGMVGDAANQGLQGVQSTGKFVGDSAQKGVQGVGQGVNSGFNTVTGAFTPKDQKKQQDVEPKAVNEAQKVEPPTGQSPAQAALADAPKDVQEKAPKSGGGFVGGVSSGFKAAGGAITTAGSTILNPAAQAGMAGAGFVKDVAVQGAQIGEKVAKTGVDMTANVVMSGAGLAGTAVGGVVSTAAETSGKVFEPVAAGLRSIEGLDGLANGLEKINGLPMAAVKQVGSLTFKAMNMSGKTPTFFDTDGDGIVRVADTKKGLIVLGLQDAHATYAAYALHTVFSYSTSSSWIPAMDTTLPIHVDKMNDTRWGKNWGQFDRIEWCSDMDVEEFFRTAEYESTVEKWKATLTKGRQGFGVLLLIFEWGTTWPFYMPPVPAADIPFKDDIGKVVRTVILPTIFKNWQRSHGIEPDKKSEPIAHGEGLNKKSDAPKA